jgi:hypothetical protein
MVKEIKGSNETSFQTLADKIKQNVILQLADITSSSFYSALVCKLRTDKQAVKKQATF